MESTNSNTTVSFNKNNYKHNYKGRYEKISSSEWFKKMYKDNLFDADKIFSSMEEYAAEQTAELSREIERLREVITWRDRSIEFAGQHTENARKKSDQMEEAMNDALLIAADKYNDLKAKADVMAECLDLIIQKANSETMRNMSIKAVTNYR